MGFAYYSPLTIDHTKVANTDQSNFPVLVNITNNRLKTIGNGGHVSNSSGFDIRPYSNSILTTTLTYELERYNASTGEVVMWVNIATVSASTDTVFYLAYGDPTISSDGSSSATWDSNYKSVFHLKDGTTLSGTDSKNSHTLTVHGSVTAVGGQVDGGASFGGTTSDYLQGADSTDYNFTTAFTWSAWVKTNDTGNFCGIMNRDDPGGSGVREFQFRKSDTDHIQVILFNNIVPTTFTSTGTFNDNNWHYLVAKYDGVHVNMYIDAGGQGSTAYSNTIDSGTGVTLYVGLTNPATFPWIGSMDEVRLSNTSRSEDWITTEYNNQNSPSTFITVGTENSLSTDFLIVPYFRIVRNLNIGY